MQSNKLVHALRKNIKSSPRFFSALLDNVLVCLTGKIPGKGPLFAVWAITPDCNLRCPFCNYRNSGDSFSGVYAELDREKKVEMVKNLAGAGVWFLSLCGGEPLLCDDIGDVIKEAKSNGMVVNISTNGLLLEEKAEIIAGRGIDFITISVDGHNPESHDKIRGHDGLFKKIENGIKTLRALSKKSPVFIELRYLISRKNHLFIGDFVETFRGKVDSITFKPVYDNPHTRYLVPKDMKFYPEDENLFLKHFNSFLKKYKSFDTDYHRNIPVFIFHPDRLKGKYLCFAGTFFGAIDSAGHVFPCHEMTMTPNEPIGNLNESDFMELWRGDSMNKVHNLFKTGLRCDCWMDRFYLNIPLQKILRPAYGKAKKPQVL